MTYAATLALPDAAAILRDAASVTLLTHAKPDGDAFGSVVALAAALNHLGTTTHAAFAPPVPDTFADMPGHDLAITTHDPADLPDTDLLVVVDTGASAQLGPLAPAFDRHHAAGRPSLIVDHHLHGDLPATHQLIDATRAANCELIAELIQHLAPTLLTPTPTPQAAAKQSAAAGIVAGTPANPTSTNPIPHSLYLGIASDTGWFRFPNTSPATHRLAATLIELGVDHANLYTRSENHTRPQKLALVTAALNSLEYLHGGRVALMTLTADDFARTGALYEETERIVDYPKIVGSTHAVALITEVVTSTGQALTRVSLRSKPAAPQGPPAIDVAAIAATLGGGGHFHAAGIKLPGPITEHVTDIRNAISAGLADSSTPQDIAG
ncbi:MAG: DHH family phosphoesterase [Planctomycetota bacterium]